jgi:arylsulfatase A-like enzyme
MAGSRGLRGKVVPWEESVRVPLIIRDPRLAAVKGGSEAAASSLDIPVTLLASAKRPHACCPRNSTTFKVQTLSTASLGLDGTA